MSIEATLAILMLLGASWSDIQTRRVSNRYWVPFVVVAAVLWIERLASGFDLDLILVSLAMTAIPYGLWYVGSFGGADAKCMMVLAWLWPGLPDLLAGATIPALDILLNAALFTIVFPLAFIAYNIARGDIRFPAMVLGVRMELAEAEQRHVWPMERVVDGRVRFAYWQRPAMDLRGSYALLRIAGIRRVWTTPKVPFMIPMTAGAIVTATVGNGLLRLLLRA